MAIPKIFISYRRGESYPDEHVARDLHNSLAAEFGSEALFRDVDDSHLLISRRFREVLTEQLAQCTDCIVVIGPKWIKDIPRLHDPDDFVRMEISEVIERPGVGVTPVMVGGALISEISDLPDDLKSLVEYGGISIASESARSSVEKLIAALKSDDPKLPLPLTQKQKWWIAAASAIALSVIAYVIWWPIGPNDSYSKTHAKLDIFNEALENFHKNVEFLNSGESQ